MAKDQFNGQWFIRQAVVDVPPTSVASFEGEVGGMDIVTWDIQEHYLVGYRAYELVPGSEAAGADEANSQVDYQPVEADAGEGRDKTVYKGNPVVAYEITDHVDVKRQYNPATGEQTNVIEENDYDRPWYERSYMRVDWSKNQVHNLFDPAVGPMDSFMFGDPVDVANYVPQNEGGADAFREEKNDKGEVNYIDFTDRLFVQPSDEACAAYSWNNQLGDCTDDEVKVRTSMLKVDPAREQDYVPLVYDDRRLGEFGYFRTERPTYDEQRGNTYSGMILLANRHDIWNGSHDKDGNLLDPKDRKMRPIVYTLSPDFPKDMIETAQGVAGEWDAVLKRVVASVRNQTQKEVEDELTTDYGDKCIFCLDLNTDGHARNGDLRYNFLYWVINPQQLGPLGFGPSSPHPETGRIVSGAAYVYGAGIDNSAALAKDVVDLLNGDLTDQDVIGADYIRRAVTGNLKNVDPRALERVANVPLSQLSTTLFGEKGAARLALLQEKGLPQAQPDLAQNQLKRIAGTPLESLLLPQEVRDTFDPSHMLGTSTNGGAATTPSGSASNDAPLSILDWGTPAAVKKLGQIDEKAESKCLWLERFSDPNVVGLAQEVKGKGLKGDALYQYLRQQIFRAVVLHELGHTLGLRHNFGGSADSLNYADEYWPLREKTTLPPATNGAISTLSPWLHSNCGIEDDTNQPACEEQRNSKMAEYQYSSIMDYGGRFNSDIHGLGHYDAAAIASGYGDLVEVFDDTVTKNLTPTVRQGIVNANSRYSPILGQGLDDALGIHYTALPQVLKGVDNIKNRKWIPRSQYNPASVDGPLKVPYMSCYDEYVDSVETCHRWDVGADAYEITSNLVQRYKEYYIFNNFQRDRVGFSGANVLQTIANRYLLPLTNMYQLWLFSTGWRSPDSPAGALAQLGTLEGFDTLWNVMAAPGYGSYQKQGNLYEQVSEEMGKSDLTIQPGDGREQFSRFDFNSGYNVFRRVLESGNFYDQIAALLALTDNDASVVGVGSDVQADVLRYSIPYYLVFPDDLNKLFGSIYRQDWQSYAPQVVNGVFTPHSILDSGVPPDGYIQSPMNFSTRVLTLLYGMAFFQSNYDLAFVQRGQVSLVGSGEVITPADGFEGIDVQDPFSGRRYVAYQQTGGTNGPWYAADYVASLAKQVDAYNAMADGNDKVTLGFQIQQEFQELEIIRSMYTSFSFSF